MSKRKKGISRYNGRRGKTLKLAGFCAAMRALFSGGSLFLRKEL